MLGIMQSITGLNLLGPDPEGGRSDLYGWSTQITCRNPMFPKVEKIIKGSSSVPALNVTSLRINYENLRERFPSEWFPFFPNLKGLNLSHNYEVDQFLSMGLPQFPYLESLNLCSNNITILPECIKECHFLRDLYLDDCKQLREIKGIPPNLKILSAIDCISLSVLSSRKLLSQAFHEAGDTQFTVPGARVPEWFAYKQPSKSLSFWVRNEFPKKFALCLVFCAPQIVPVWDLLVNGKRHDRIWLSITSSGKPHIYIVHFERGRDSIANVPIAPGWNHVRFEECNKESGSVVSWIGFHKCEEENGIENVRFTDPNSDKKIVDYSGGTDNNHAIHLTKKWCSLLDMQVLHFDRPIKYRAHWEIQIWKGVWMMQAPIEVKFLMRKVLFNALPTGMNLYRRKVINNPLCPICETDYETVEHVFMFCEWTRPVWFGSNLQWDVFDSVWCFWFSRWISKKIRERIQADVPGLQWELPWHGMDAVIVEGQPLSKIMGIVGNICWAIWKGRNEYVVESKPVDPKLALSRVKILSQQYSRGYPLIQGQIMEDDNKAEGKSVLMASSSSNIKGNTGQDGLSLDHDTTCDTPVAWSTIVEGHMTEDDNKAKGKSVWMASSNSNIKENIGQGGLSVDHYTTIVKVFPEDDEETQAADPQVQNPPQLKEIASEVQTEGRIQRSTSAGSEPTHSDKPSTAHNLTPKILKVAETVPRPMQTLTAPTQKVFTAAPANRPVPKLLGTGLISSDEKEEQPSKGNSTGDGFKRQLDFEDYLKGNDLEDLDIEIPPEQLNTNCDSIKKILVKQDNNEEDEDSDEDPFAILNSLASEGSLLTSSNQPVQPIAAEKIQDAVSSLQEVLSQNLQAVVENPDSSEKLESSLQILKDTTESDPPISVGFKTFIMDIAENFPSMVADLRKASTMEKDYQFLTRQKQELLDFGKSGERHRKSLLEKRRAWDDKISALKAKISELQQELKQLEESRTVFESELQTVKTEEQELKQKGKKAIKKYKSIDARLSLMESEYRAMSDLKMSTEAKWDNFRANFKCPFTNL